MELFKDMFASDALTYEEFSKRLAAAGVDESGLLSQDKTFELKELEMLKKIRDMEEKHKMEMLSARAEGILMAELVRQGALNPALAAKVIDLDGFENAEDLQGEIAGRVASLRQSEPYLFISYKEIGSTGLRHGSSRTDVDGMSDFDYYSKYRFKDSI